MTPVKHVDRRPLGGDDQVDAGGARLLRQALDGVLDLLAGGEHQVGHLVDDDHDERQRASCRSAALP